MKTSMFCCVGRRVLVVGWLVAASAAFAQGPRDPQAPQGPGQPPRAPVVVPVPVANPAPVAILPNPNAGRPAPQLNPLGQPLAGLTAAELAAFSEGGVEFRSAETVAGGLGPIFNDVSCIACHDAGGTGGASRRTVTRFGRTVNGVFDPLERQGGSLLQERSINPGIREVVPREANTVARRVTTPLFGAGLIEAIPDSTIMLGTLGRKPAGIAGKVSVVRDVVSGKNLIGRFGWKAQQATLLAFSGDAYLNEMGITNRFFPKENAPNGNAELLARFDRVADVEDGIDPLNGKADIDRAADFIRLLAPPPRGPATASSVAGEAIFGRLDCAVCHTPTMRTGRQAIAALSGKDVGLYSDLLLHDMGALGDGIAQGTAGARDMRTAPLWGLRSRPTWLHDGRANTVDQAVRGHAGEAQDSRNRYGALSAVERQQLLDFLNTL
ncbi:MAG: hypothetical protein CK548_00765 [Opitutia bacterium]|nr:MAG: hypothetical protein CK548_00765 [Opitutae bacterium]